MARDRDRRKGDKAGDRRRVQKKKVSILTQERIEWVDYKDVNLLRRFMSERAKIRARRVTGNSQQQQRAVARAIRVAREMALLPYSVRQVTQRSRGGGRGRDRERADLSAPMPTPDAPPPTAGEATESTESTEATETMVATGAPPEQGTVETTEAPTTAATESGESSEEAGA